MTSYTTPYGLEMQLGLEQMIGALLHMLSQGDHNHVYILSQRPLDHYVGAYMFLAMLGFIKS